MIKAIIFDFGNVICTFDNNIFLKKISHFSDKSLEELDKIIYQNSGLPKKYESGIISSDDFFSEISKLCNLSMSREDFIEAYTNIFFPIPETFDLIKKLSKNYKLALLSNTSEWDFKYGIKKFDVIGLFDTISLSFEIGEMKPGEKIYKDALEKLKFEPSECVYMDDIEKYVDVAKGLGINGIYYTSPENLTEELKNLEVKID
jgi:epoxide hydrolase-like predicted phosphatase